MWKKLIFLFIILTTLLFTSNANQDRALLFLGNENLPPYLYIENEVNKGIVIDILEEMQKHMHFKFDIKLTDWAKAQEMLIRDEADALLHININEERKKIYDFSNELVKSEFCIFVKNTRTDIRGLEDLIGLKVGVEEKGQPGNILKDKINIEGIYYQDIKEAFIDLSYLKIDAIVIDKWVGEYILATNRIYDIRVIKEPIDISFSRIAVRKGNQELLNDINKSLKIIQNDGVFNTVLEKWETKRIIYMTREQIIKYIIIVISIVLILMAIVIILLIISLIKLKKANEKIISLNKNIELELQSTNQMLQLVMNSIPQTIFWKDINSVYLGCNNNFLKAVGLKDVKDLIGKTDHDLSWTKEQADSFRDYDKKVMNSGKAELHIIESGLQADGTTVWADTNKIPLKDPKGQIIGILGTYEDITKRKHLEEELIKAKKKADKASKAKSDFLVNMSHEIRTPLNGVIGFTELLKNTKLSKVQQQYINNANVSARTLLGIINNILDFSKIEAGMLSLEMIKTDIVELLENTLDIVKFTADKKKIELLLNIDASIPQFALTDPIRLKQILVNLLSNAVKFTEKGEVELKVKYEDLNDRRGKISFFVRDTGIGITEEQKEKLFKAFSQGDSSTTRKFGGTGLGLVISDLIAKKMGSKIQIESKPYEGSTFHFDIIADIEKGKKSDKKQIDNINRCLIIDDNASNRIILGEMLSSWNIAYEACSDGLTALNLLKLSKDFDVIICDYDMPDPNGLETIRMIREDLKMGPEKYTIILLLNSSNDVEIHKKCQLLDVRFMLTKPVKGSNLHSFLHQVYGPISKIKNQVITVKNETEKAVFYKDDLKILIAEDVAINLMLIEAIIGEILPNAQLHEASNGQQAIKQFKDISPDLIFMDVQMPEMNGLDATRKIREMEKDTSRQVPIIALTAGAFKEEMEKCFAAGMDDFLTKPIESKKIKVVLEKYLPKP